MKTIAFFNNKGGVGKTSLCYHLAWMYSELGIKVVAVDLDPQANLSSMFLNEDRLEELWPDEEHLETIYSCVAPLAKAIGDIQSPHIEEITFRLGLVVGDLELSRFEPRLSADWNNCLDGAEAAFRVVSSLHRIVQDAGRQRDAQIGLIDVGPNLGALNRSALLAADYLVIPLAADLFSLQGLKNLGPTLSEWQQQWTNRRNSKPLSLNIELPTGQMDPLGYVVLQHAVRLDRPVKAYKKWMDRIPQSYSREVLRKELRKGLTVSNDPNCLASLKNYRSLMPYAQDARKPIFLLKPADGALGGHMAAVQNCYDDFQSLAIEIANRIETDIPNRRLF